MSGSGWAVLAGLRVLRALLAVVAVAAVAWCLVEAAPGSTAERAAHASGLLPRSADIAPADKVAILDQVARHHGLERSLPARIATYVGGLAAADLGSSWRDGTPVSNRVAPATIATLTLIIASLIVACVLGIGLAVFAAERPGSRRDLAIAVASAVAISVPLSWLGMLALRTFAAGQPFSWFPVFGLGVLPVLTLAIIPAAVIARHARAALIEGSRRPWAIAVRARGASTRRVIAVHALMAAAPSLLALVPALVGYLLGASLVVERVFGIQGLGWLITDASARGDAPVVVGVSVVAAAVLGFASAWADVVAKVIDPREVADA